MSNLKRDNETKCCDNCIFYEWYYDRCKRWMCFISNQRKCLWVLVRAAYD